MCLSDPSSISGGYWHELLVQKVLTSLQEDWKKTNMLICSVFSNEIKHDYRDFLKKTTYIQGCR